jgi:hypothetical protein
MGETPVHGWLIASRVPLVPQTVAEHAPYVQSSAGASVGLDDHFKSGHT